MIFSGPSYLEKPTLLLNLTVLIFGLTLHKFVEYRRVAPGGISRVLKVFVRDGAVFFML